MRRYKAKHSGIKIGAGGGIRTHEGLRHRISPEPDLKSSTLLLSRRGVSCPFGLIPAHEMSMRRLLMGLGNARSQAQANPCGRCKAQTTLDPGHNPCLPP